MFFAPKGYYMPTYHALFFILVTAHLQSFAAHMDIATVGDEIKIICFYITRARLYILQM